MEGALGAHRAKPDDEQTERIKQLEQKTDQVVMLALQVDPESAGSEDGGDGGDDGKGDHGVDEGHAAATTAAHGGLRREGSGTG